MAGGDRRKCKCCLKLFRPDPRNRRHQRYCSCRRLSSGQQSRQPSTLARHGREPRLLPRPGERRPGPGVAVAPSRLLAQGRRVGTALQDLSMAQPVDSPGRNSDSARSPLQEVLTAQPAVLIGLIAHIVGTPLQDDIVRTTDRLLRLGQDILATSTARAATPAPDGGAGRDRLRDVLQDPRLP